MFQAEGAASAKALRLGPWRTAGVRAPVSWSNKPGEAWSLGPRQPPQQTSLLQAPPSCAVFSLYFVPLAHTPGLNAASVAPGGFR